MRPSTTFLTTWTPTLMTVSYTELAIWFLLHTQMLDSIMNPRAASNMDPTSYWRNMNQYQDVIGPILKLSQVIKFLISSAAEVELGYTLITAKKIVPMRQTLIEMGWPQPPTPIQTDNSLAEGVLNYTIIAQKNKSMDLRFHWLRFREAQQNFSFYWAPVSKKWADYSTKHHPPIYHESKRLLFAGAAQRLYQALLAHL